MKILICDESGEVLQTVLQRQDLTLIAELVIVVHWQNAIEMLDKQRFDIVMMGMQLPYSGCDKLMHHIRKVLGVSTPVVVV